MFIILSQITKVFKRLFMLSILVTIVFSASYDSKAQNMSTKASPQQMVDALHAAFGVHNARAVHAKGIILEGTFMPTKSAKGLSKALHLQSKTLPVTFRFSDFTGIPDIADTTGASNPRGLAIKFHLPDGSSTDIIAHSFNGFPTATTDEFREFLLDISKSGPEAAHPNAIEQFLDGHPIAKTFVTTQKAPSFSYATLAYFGVNAFKFTNAKGIVTYIRYQFIPDAGEKLLSAEEFKNSGPDYLSYEIKNRIAKGPIKYNLYAQIAKQGDKIEDPSVAWPDDREKILLGVLTINSLGDNTGPLDKKLIFNPGNLPTGIEVADQMLADRIKAYPISAKERQ